MNEVPKTVFKCSTFTYVSEVLNVNFIFPPSGPKQNIQPPKDGSKMVPVSFFVVLEEHVAGAGSGLSFYAFSSLTGSKAAAYQF